MMAKHNGLLTMQRMATAVAATQDLAVDPLDVAIPLITWDGADIAADDEENGSALAVTSSLVEYRDPLAILLMLEDERMWFYSNAIDDSSSPTL
jgi:hypothetical protein